MDHLEGADKTGDVRLGFDRRVRLEFHGSKISSDGGLLLFRELDEVLGLQDIAGGALRGTRTGRNRPHSLIGLLRQSVFGRLAGYDDVNDADRMALDPVMRQVVGGRAVDAKAASATSLQTRLIKIGARVVRHARAITFQLAEVAISGDLFHRILAAIHRLHAPPVTA